MPVKRLFSAITEPDSIDSQLENAGTCRILPSNNSYHSIGTDIWVTEDSNDSGLGSEDIFTDSDSSPSPKRPRRSDIDSVLANNTDLVADGSRMYCLPTIPGKHKDLKNITPQTLSDVLSGRYQDVITSYRIIDCRFPYEFSGGHVKSAENRFNKDMIGELLLDPSPVQVLIFHCEFSQERGPNMLRHLRNTDRQLNCDSYPTLSFPEVYLVDGGYEAIYQTQPSVCNYPSYTPMTHPDYAENLRCYRRTSNSMHHFRSKAKSWSSGDKPRIPRKFKL